MLPGGFSGGDEPDGSGKFITAFFKNPSIKNAVHNLLNNRDGLMLGICRNNFVQHTLYEVIRITVFSAPLTIHNGEKRSLTDIILEQGENAKNGIKPTLDTVKSTYQKILEQVNSENRENCKNVIQINS